MVWISLCLYLFVCFWGASRGLCSRWSGCFISVCHLHKKVGSSLLFSVLLRILNSFEISLFFNKLPWETVHFWGIALWSICYSDGLDYLLRLSICSVIGGGSLYFPKKEKSYISPRFSNTEMEKWRMEKISLTWFS